VQRYARLWAELLRLSWRRMPALSLGMFALQAGTLVAGVGTAVALRAVVDATVKGAVATALFTAGSAALACMLALSSSPGWPRMCGIW
jgi:hypothetical protein